MRFLSTRVKSPTEGDWKKVRRMVHHLQDTNTLVLTLEAKDTHVVTWWVEAAFAVLADMKSRNGGEMSMGKGMVYSASTRP